MSCIHCYSENNKLVKIVENHDIFLRSIIELLGLPLTSLCFWENWFLTLLHGIRAVRFWDRIPVTTPNVN